MDDESRSRGNWLALREDDGRAYLLRRAPGEVKIKGLGRFDAEELLEGYSLGDRIKVGQKSLTIVIPSLPEAGGTWPGGLRSSAPRILVS